MPEPAPDKSIKEGPRGGRYYLNQRGKKVYIGEGGLAETSQKSERADRKELLRMKQAKGESGPKIKTARPVKELAVEAARAADRLSSGPNAMAEAAVRNSIDESISALGLHNADRDASRRLHFRPGEGHDGTGYRAWNGDITVHADPKAVARALDDVASGRRPSDDDAHALHVVVHETVHGHGKLEPRHYRAEGARVEEVMTEVLTRQAMRESFGIDSSLIDDGSGRRMPYQAEIDAMINDVGDATKFAGVDPTPIIDRIQKAAARVKQRDSVPDGLLDAFTDALDLKGPEADAFKTRVRRRGNTAYNTEHRNG